MGKFPQLAPHRPSKKHVWEVINSANGSFHEHCKRCGCRFSPQHDFGIAALYCNPTPDWLREHPNDDMEEF